MLVTRTLKLFCAPAVLAGLLVLSSAAMATNIIIHTDLGDIEFELFDDTQPLTVVNFLNYINDGGFSNNFIHRSIPGFVIQGGGFTFMDGVSAEVPKNPPVQNEPGRSNVRGTIAMAKFASDPNSATSEWFINLADNSSNLDNQNGGFTVFGQVVGDGMLVADAIAALPVWNAGNSFPDLPLIDYPGGVAITAEYLVMTSTSIVNNFVINAGVNDAWVNDGAALQGIFITAFPSLNLVFMAWFTFDSVPPVFSGVASPDSSGVFGKSALNSKAVFGADDQRWVTALGTIEGNRAVLTAELTSGGTFNSSEPLPTQVTDYGTIILEFEDCENANVEFDFPAAGESGQFDVHRVLEDNVALCEALQAAGIL